MFYIIYQTTNLLNGKIYIGVHQTNNVEDQYLGSGKLLLRAVRKYGREHFNKKVLFKYETLTEALDKEKEIVTQEFIKRKDTYNISIGGGVGGKNINGLTFEGRKHTKESKEKIREALARREHKLSDEALRRIIHNNKTNKERKRKISETLKGQPKTTDHKKNLSVSLQKYYEDNPSAKDRNKGPKPKIKCPHCGKEGSANNMSRWHFDKCKYFEG